MISIEKEVSLATSTYYKIGGPAAYFLEAKSNEELLEGIHFAREKSIPFFILGAGSNVLIADTGYRGLIIRFKTAKVTVSGEYVAASAGVPMALLVQRALSAGLVGVEWGVGIPGTVGGSIRGNAGCFGGEIKDVLEKAEIYDSSGGSIRWVGNTECFFGYRDSIFKKHPEWIVLSGEFRLHKGDTDAARARLKEYALKRSQSQAIGSKSAGCIFKNISWQRPDVNSDQLLARFPSFRQFIDSPGIPASYCVDAANLKGTRIGNVEISPKHGNYFVNLGGATAEEVIILIGIAKDHVRRKFGLLLEEEIQYVGF